MAWKAQALRSAIATLTLLSPGLCTLLVDHGRPRSRSLGVPVGGAADRAALALGNTLVGNPPDAPALEVCLSGPTLVADADLACVIFGAPFEIWTAHRRLRVEKTFTLQAGKELTLGGTPSGARAYFCVQGGLTDALILGSYSSLQPLAAGAKLSCREGRIGGRFPAVCFLQPRPRRLRYLPGAQADWFPAGALQGRTLTVTPASNRMGLRLQGEPLPVTGREMESEPVCPGSVQVTRDGQCIVLGVDGQTIGGYPKIAQVITADLDKLGQLRPGERITFEPVSLADAESAYRLRQAELAAWCTRLRASL
jgi:antagonist of KipI